MEKAEDNVQINCVRYSIEQIQRKAKVSTIKELIESIPMIKFVDNEILTIDEGSVRLFLNGTNPINKVGDQVYNLPVEAVAKIEFYALSEHNGFL